MALIRRRRGGESSGPRDIGRFVLSDSHKSRNSHIKQRDSQAVTESYSPRWLLLTWRWSNANARVALTDELDQSFGIALEGVGGFREVEPLFQDRMGRQAWELAKQAFLMLVKSAHEYALPWLALGGEEEAMHSAEHDRAAAKPGPEFECFLVEQGISQPLQRMLGLHGLGSERSGAGGGFHWRGGTGHEPSRSKRSSQWCTIATGAPPDAVRSGENLLAADRGTFEGNRRP